MWMKFENISAGELSWVGAEQVQTALVCIPCQGNQHPPHLDHVEDVVELEHDHVEDVVELGHDHVEDVVEHGEMI